MAAHPPVMNDRDVEVHETHHIVPLKVYYLTFAFLMVMLVVTLWAATWELGPLNVVVAMLIAFAKAIAVVLYFMHVRYSSRLIQVFAASAFVWLAIMFVLTLSDYFTRGWLGQPGH